MKQSDSFVPRKDFLRELNEMQTKSSQEIRNIVEFFKKELDSNLHHIHEANRVVFGKIERDMTDLRQYSDTINNDLSSFKKSTDDNRLKNVFSSNKKFFDARVVKYRETLQRIP